MAKQLVFGEEARRYLKAGVDTVANAVATTLGPKGRNVALDRKFGSPTITHDGVTVAKEIELEDPYCDRRPQEPGCRRKPHAAQARYRSCCKSSFRIYSRTGN